MARCTDDDVIDLLQVFSTYHLQSWFSVRGTPCGSGSGGQSGGSESQTNQHCSPSQITGPTYFIFHMRENPTFKCASAFIVIPRDTQYFRRAPQSSPFIDNQILVARGISALCVLQKSNPNQDNDALRQTSLLRSHHYIPSRYGCVCCAFGRSFQTAKHWK